MQKVKNSPKDIYQEITNLIIGKLEQGFIPWRRPWSAYGAAASYITKKPYRGVNALLMNMLNHEKPYYLTFKQAKELGGTVKKGSKSVPVLYWNFYFRHAETGKKLSEAEARKLPSDKVKKSAFLREYKVFNIDQVDNIEFDIPEVVIKPENEIIDSCESIVTGMPNAPRIRHDNAKKAFYVPSRDYINIPPIRFFDSSEFYYDTLFHELIHSTGHQSRLNRPEITEHNSFGSENYSKEELVAELGGSFLCGVAGIQDERTIENNTAYIQGWVKRLKNDKKLIIEAAAKAQKAADFMFLM
tara:strand:+ start:675 stop:1574 length:900 start_codon:yes stop_codon:yes gene_type:complete